MKMQSRYTILLIVCCVHVLKSHLAAGNVFDWGSTPSNNSSEDCKKCNGECLESNLICDGIDNCSDGSDEVNCDFIKCREPKYFKCQDSKCISATDICNKQKDCEGGEDEEEENCKKKLYTAGTCLAKEFRCSNNRCILESWTCDGADDCGDNSDETRGCELKKCREHEFKCKSSKCIPQSFRCDGNPDCGAYDRSDEEHCEYNVLDMINCTSNQGKFACKDKLKCIDIFKACDNTVDCFDGSDEGGLCFNLSIACTNCTHKCFRTPEKPVCSCTPGFLMTSNNSCIDVNECEEYGICDQKCSNTEGSYSCSCESPYQLQNDKRTCKMDAGDGAILFYSTSSGLKELNLQSHANLSIYNYAGGSFAVSVAGSNVYWTTMVADTAKIYRASLNDYIPHEIITSGLGILEDIDVDWITGNIYFTDSKFGHIAVCDGSAQHCVVLHLINVDVPKFISLSPETGLLFWTDWGSEWSEPMIAKAGMDGSKPEVIVSENVPWPSAVCTDTPNERVYWVDAKQHAIESIKFDGSDRRLVSSDHVGPVFSISVFENKLYWSNWEANEISQCDKFTGKNKKSLVRDPSIQIFGVRVQHPSLHGKDIENPCAKNICSDLCLLAPGFKTRLRHTCACPVNKELTENLETCRLKKSAKFLIAAYKNNVYLTEPNYLGRTTFKKATLDVESIMSMAYDYSKGQLIVADSKSAFMKSYNFSMEETITLRGGGVVHVPSMQYDDFGNNLYWCNWDSLTIEAMNLNTYSKTVIFSGSNAESPIDIALVPSKGYMFVAFQISYSRVQIDRLSMDGSLTSRSRFLDDRLLGPILKMFYDVTEKRLYWADVTNGKIESVDENGEDRSLHVKTLNLFSMVSVDGSLFWTKKRSPYIFWIDSSVLNTHVNLVKLDIDKLYEDEGIILTNPNDNHVVKPSSPCLTNNGGCSHLCLVSSESHRISACACPIGFALSANGVTCKVPHKCSPSQFTCFTGECISLSKVCDKRKDCLHGEDESLENCRLSCPEGQFLCHDGKKCIDTETRCDGKFDCDDQSDEICHVNCTGGKFKCDDGECIESQFRCDGKVDCKDGLDERNCHLTTCKSDEFRCTSGQCIHQSWYCDGQIDCTDGSDEMTNCSFSGAVCRPDEFHCTNGRCVDVQVTCNRHDDCGDNSDEDKECVKNPYIYKQPVWYPVSHQLHVFKTCNSRIEFQCPTKAGKHCIPLASRCDGIINCLNGEDEQNCSLMKCAHDEEFFCKNTKRCIPDEWVCDNHDDCGDNSDEAAAACITKNVTKTACIGFQCANGGCITLSKVCDDMVDCLDKSDEGGLCGTGCEKFGCSHKCHETPKGPYCTCDHGYTLGHDNKTCQDIDECKLGICAQNCRNTPGSFVCSCFSSDYTLKSDRVTCKANGDAAHFVIASLNEMNIVTNNWMRVSHPLELPIGSTITAMDVNSKESIVYSVWDHSVIVRIDVLKLGVKSLTVPFITSIAADWITENVYYIKEYRKIMVASFSKNNSAIVYVVKRPFRILSIAIDPVAGYLFWYESYDSDPNKHAGMIMRSDCSGANNINISSSIANAIESMAVDSYEESLYVYERYESSIVRLNYDGSDASIALRFEPHVTGFSFFESSIYWASENSDVYPIRKCKIYGLPPRKCEVIRSKLTNVRYFALMQRNRQRIVSNPCENHACSGICTSSPTGPKCLSFGSRNLSIESYFQFPKRIETASSYSRITTFAYFVFVVLSLIVVGLLGFFVYRYYKPKSAFFRRFRFYTVPLNRSEQLINSRGSGINELVTSDRETRF